MLNLLSLVALALPAAAFPAKDAVAPAGHEYQAPGPNDVRSPCPGLNSLANHGFLNRSGKNITVPQLIAGGAAGLGMGIDFMTSIGGLALFAPAKPNGVSLNLDDLKEHNFPIEHDVSMSRQDYYYDHDDIDFYEPNYEEFISHFDGLTETTLATTAAARVQRFDDSLATNPTLTFGPEAFLFGYGESGLFTQTMGSSPLAVSAPVAYIESLFVQQRLPYELGWTPSVVPITLVSLGTYIVQLFAAADQKLPQGLEALTIGSYRMMIADLEALASKRPSK